MTEKTTKTTEPPKFKAILADPPWHYEVWSDKGTGRSASQHYKVMSSADIEALPVRDIADKDCVLFLWATYPLLPEALRLMAAWGFEYKTTAFTWVKTQNGRPFYGMGHWTRANSEICLLGTMGKPKRVDAGVEGLILAEMGDHSAKPYEQYRRIERLVSGPYVELFSRLKVPGWWAWGNQVGGRGGHGGHILDLPGLPATEASPDQLELPSMHPI